MRPKLHKASFIAPQHTGGDTDEPATWIPVCAQVMHKWYENLQNDFRPIEIDDRLPNFSIKDGMLLTPKEWERHKKEIKYKRIPKFLRS